MLHLEMGSVQCVTRFAHRREYDVVAERGFIDRAKEVEVIEVHGNRIVVREVRSCPLKMFAS